MATPVIFRGAAAAFVNKEFDWDSDTWGALLLDSSYTVDANAHVYVTDLSHEISGGSYARVAIASKTIDSTSAGVVKLKCDDIVFAAMTATNVNYCVVYRNSGSDATSKLLCVIQTDSTISPSTQTVTFDLGSNGLVNLTV